MQQGIPRNFLLHKKQRQVLFLPPLSSYSANVCCLHIRIFLSLAVSAIIHRVPGTVSCAILAAVFRTVLAVSALILCLIVGLRLAALHVVVHIIAVSCHFFVPPRVVFMPRTFSAAASSIMVRSLTIMQFPQKELLIFSCSGKTPGSGRHPRRSMLTGSQSMPEGIRRPERGRIPREISPPSRRHPQGSQM